MARRTVKAIVVVATAILAVLGSWLGTASQSAANPPLKGIHAYTYDGQHEPSAFTADTTAGAQPPTTERAATANITAAEHWVPDVSVRTRAATAPPTYAYNDRAPLAQVTQSSGTPQQRDRALVGDLSSITPGGVAAKTVDNILPTPQVGSTKLQNLVDNLYKGTTNPNRVGNGTTMDAIRNELATGVPTGGRMHSIKGQETLNGLNNWLRRNPDASYYDRLVGQSLADELSLVLRGGG